MTKVLAPLKFKDYIWPHNPTLYGIKFARDIVQHRYPDTYGAEIQDMLLQARVFSGSGKFHGPNAYKEFQKLATVFYDKGPGQLIHPIWMPTTAVFTRLEVNQEPTPDYVEYTFEFIEHTDIYVIEEVTTDSTSVEQQQIAESTLKIHIVKQDEYLGGIAELYGLTWKDLADANADIIEDPNMIYIGQELKIP